MKLLTICLSLYLISLTSIFSQELSVFSGFGHQYYEDDNRIDKAEFVQLINSDTKAKVYMDKSKNLMILSYLSIAGYVGMALWANTDIDNLALPTVGGISFLAVSIGTSLGSLVQRKKAVLKYNKGFDNDQGYGLGDTTIEGDKVVLSLGTTMSGFGFVLTY